MEALHRICFEKRLMTVEIVIGSEDFSKSGKTDKVD